MMKINAGSGAATHASLRLLQIADMSDRILRSAIGPRHQVMRGRFASTV